MGKQFYTTNIRNSENRVFFSSNDLYQRFFIFSIDSIFLMSSFDCFHSFVQYGKKVTQKVDVRVANICIVFLKTDLVLNVLSLLGSK